jgi:hypothetical protein
MKGSLAPGTSRTEEDLDSGTGIRENTSSDDKLLDRDALPAQQPATGEARKELER